MAFERRGKAHMDLTTVIEKYFGADAGYLDISCLDLARRILEAGYEKPVRCKDCQYWWDRGCGKGTCDRETEEMGLSRLYRESDFCSYGERKENGTTKD